jgi:protein phosphatase-4 regulatory subunit 3
MYMSVVSEESGERLLHTRIFDGEQYQRQQETLIVWSDPNSGEDLALSFQLRDGCNEIWAQIEDYRIRRGGLASPGSDSELKEIAQQAAQIAAAVAPSTQSEEIAALMTASTELMLRRSSTLTEIMEAEVELPQPTLSNLTAVSTVLAECSADARKSALTSAILKLDYVAKLLEVFDTCEDLEAEDHLRTIFSIFKTLVMMNEPLLLEILFS